MSGEAKEAETRAHVADITDGVASTMPLLQSQTGSLAVITNQVVPMAAEQLSSNAHLLEKIRGRLVECRRPDILGQLRTFTVLGAALGETRCSQTRPSRPRRLSVALTRTFEVNARSHHFPGHLHLFLRMLIEQHKADAAPCCFAVFNKSSQMASEVCGTSRYAALRPATYWTLMSCVHSWLKRHAPDHLTTF